MHQGIHYIRSSEIKIEYHKIKLELKSKHEIKTRWDYVYEMPY